MPELSPNTPHEEEPSDLQGEGLEIPHERTSAYDLLRMKGYAVDEIASGDVSSEDWDLVDRLQA